MSTETEQLAAAAVDGFISNFSKFKHVGRASANVRYHLQGYERHYYKYNSYWLPINSWDDWHDNMEQVFDISKAMDPKEFRFNNNNDEINPKDPGIKCRSWFNAGVNLAFKMTDDECRFFCEVGGMTPSAFRYKDNDMFQIDNNGWSPSSYVDTLGLGTINDWHYTNGNQSEYYSVFHYPEKPDVPVHGDPLLYPRPAYLMPDIQICNTKPTDYIMAKLLQCAEDIYEHSNDPGTYWLWSELMKELIFWMTEDSDIEVNGIHVINTGIDTVYFCLPSSYVDDGNMMGYDAGKFQTLKGLWPDLPVWKNKPHEGDGPLGCHFNPVLSSAFNDLELPVAVPAKMSNGVLSFSYAFPQYEKHLSYPFAGFAFDPPADMNDPNAEVPLLVKSLDKFDCSYKVEYAYRVNIFQDLFDKEIPE
jgi:hypothetical protein